MKIKIIKFLITFVISLPIISFIHTGFSNSSIVQNIQVVFFSLMISVFLYWPEYKRKILVLILSLIIVMAIFFTLGKIGEADLAGSTAFGLIMIFLLTNLPMLFKKGYFEDL